MTKPPAALRFPLIAMALAAGAALLASRAAAANCQAGAFAAAAGANAVSVNALAWSPFGRAEVGWAIYEPLVRREIGADCGAATPAFAAALARWQGGHGLRASGVMDGDTFAGLKAVWQARRPFVIASRRGCPAAPGPGQLAEADAASSYGGKHIMLTSAALAAYRQMVAAARRDLPDARRDPQLLTVFSGFRSPEADAARCASELNCQGVTRAACSAHRTGKALDLDLGAAPGYGPDSSADVNRLYQSRTAAYHWLVANAARFGFANYAFEPWHWEWTG